MQVKTLLLAVCWIAVSFPSFARTETASSSAKTRPLKFIRNEGQIKDQHGHLRSELHSRLKAGSNMNIFTGAGLLVYQWQGNDAMYRMEAALVGAKATVQPVYEMPLPYTERYMGSGKEITARSCGRMVYPGVYPNIDWVLYTTTDGHLKYDFIVHPGGKVSDIQIKYSGATALSLQQDGSLSVQTPMGSIGEHAPLSYTREGKAVGSRFLLSDSIVSFNVDDYAGTLVIDPELSWSTYYGGTDKEIADAIAIDPWGNTYISGYTLSTDNIATTGAYQTSFEGSNLANNAGDAFVAKFNCAGEQQWATYYGGESAERAWNIVADKYGHIYFAGFTNLLSGLPTTDNLATTGSYQPTAGGGTGDAFLVKMDSAGNRIWATYYGGPGAENSPLLPVGLALDNEDHIYLAGTTNSTTGIASIAAYQSAAGGGNDAFLVQFDTAGNRQWATYYGNTGNDRAASVTCDASGNVYLTGITNSISGIASSGSHQTTFAGGSDAFLVKFNNSGSRLWATYYGGPGTIDEGMSVYADTTGNIYMAGRTNSSSGISSTGSYQPNFKGGLADAFLTKFDSTGLRLWGTYYGGINNGAMHAFNSLHGDNHGGILLTCLGRDTDSMATAGSFQETANGSDDGVLARFNEDGTLDWATYYGGAAADLFSAVRADGLGNIYLAGGTMSDAVFATSGSHQDLIGGGYDAFLVKFSDTTYLPFIDSVFGPAVLCDGATGTFYVNPVPGAIGYSWTIPSGWTGSSSSDSITVTTDHTSGSISVYPIFPCNDGGSILKSIEVINATILPLTDTAMCLGDTILLKALVAEELSWQWFKDGISLTGETDSVLSVAIAGLYSVAVHKEGCADTAHAVSAYFHDLPEVTVTISGDTLIATPGFTDYQWKHAGADIMGAVSNHYLPLIDGVYSVSVIDSNGCSNESLPYNYNGETSLRGPKGIGEIRIFPNPTGSILTVDAPAQYLLKVVAPDGRVLLEADRPDNQIDVSELSSGLYLLQLHDKKGRHVLTLKFIKA